MSVSLIIFIAEFEYIFTGWHPTGFYLLKVNKRKTRKRCEICSKLTIKTLE